MKKNYLESILGLMTLILAVSFLLKFIDVNTESNETYDLKAKFLKEIILLVSLAESLKCLTQIFEIVPDPTRFVFF